MSPVLPRLYDTFLEPLVRGYREAGVRLAGPQPGMRVLDAGCGTGTHLALYAAAGCEVAGVDLDPRMVARAADRLGPGADIREADASDLPYRDGSFDLALAMLMLHEQPPADRVRVMAELQRVAGRVLVVDHHPEPEGTLRGRAIRWAAGSIERLAGGDHYRNYRQFLASGGLPALASAAGLAMLGAVREGSGSMGVYLLR